MKKIISFFLVLMMAASMMISVSAEETGGFIIDSHFDELGDAQKFFENTSNKVLASEIGYGGSSCAANFAKGKNQMYPKFLPEFKEGKTYHVTFLAKGNNTDLGNFKFHPYGVEGKIQLFGQDYHDFTAWAKNNYVETTVTKSDWSRIGFKFTASKDAVPNYMLTNDGFKTQTAVLIDEYTVVEETSADSAAYTRPQIYGAAVSGASGTLKKGDKLTATANTYDVNSNVVPKVSYKWMKSTDGNNWTEIKTVDATVSTALNSYNTYTATSEYNVTSADENSIIKAVATAESTGTASGKKTASAESASVGELGLMEISVGISGEGTLKFGGKEIKNGDKVSVAYSGDAEFEISCDDSHMISSVTYDGNAVEVKMGKFKISSVKASGSLSVAFSEIVTEVYVSPDGDDSAAGTLEAPFKTLERAQSHIRSVKALGKNISGNYVVNLRKGTYYRTSAFELDENDSGSEKNRVVYKAYNGEKVVVSGAKKLDYSAFKPVEGEMKNLIRSKTAREKVLVADLKELGMDVPGAYSYQIYPAWLKNVPVISYNGKKMQLSRWPNGLDNRAWTTIDVGSDLEGTNVGSNDTPMVAAYTSDIPSSWEYSVANGDIYMTGVWNHWYNNVITKVSIDTEKKLVTAGENGKQMDTSERKAQFWNVYEEIDLPGEMYIDRKAGKIYIYPYDDSSNAEFSVASYSGNLVSLNGTDYVTFDGIEFTGQKGADKHAVTVNGDAHHNEIKNCVVRGNEGYGIGIYSSSKTNYADGGNNRIENCDVYDNGASGIYIMAGNRYGDPVVDSNNTISDCSIHDNSYLYYGRAQVVFSGCGNSLLSSDIYNGSYIAVEFAGANSRIANCSIHDINMNTTDMGAIYNGRDMSFLGNVIENNHLFNMAYGKLFLSQYNRAYKGGIIFTDDGSSFMTVKGNMFGPNVGNESFGFKVNGGMGNVVSDNIIIDAGNFVSIADWGTAKMNEKFSGKWMDSWVKLSTNKYWLEKYPVLSYGKDAETFKKVDTVGNTVKNNAVVYIENTKSEPNYEHTFNYLKNIPSGYELKGFETNTVIEDASEDLFTDWDNGNLKPTAEFYEKTGIEEIPYDEIGHNKTSKYAPKAENASVIADSAVSVKAKYTYSDKDGDAEGNTYVEWFSANASSSTFRSLGRYGSELEITPDLSGKKIRYEVTPFDENGVRGEKVTSAFMLISGEGDADKSALNELIFNAETLLDNSVVGTADGCYEQKDVDEFKTAVENAKAVANSADSNQYAVDTAVKSLNSAVTKFKAAAIQNAEYMSIAGLLKDPDNWVVVNGDKDGFKDGTLTLENGDRITYSKEKYHNKIFTFNLELKSADGVTEPNLSAAIYFGTVDPDKQIWLTSGYDLWMKTATLECQRWPGNELYSFENKYLKAGSKHKISIGVSGTGDNQKYLFYVDDTLVYSREFDSKITGEGYFGFGCTGNVNLIITPVEVDFTKLDKKIAEAEAFAAKATGTLYGQYSEDEMEKLKSKLDDVKKLRNSDAAAQETCDRNVIELEAAIDSVKDSVVCSQTITKDESLVLNEGKPKADFIIEKGAKLELSENSDETLPEINVSAVTDNGNIDIKFNAGTKLSDNPFTAFEELDTASGIVTDDMNVNGVYVIGSSSGINSDKLVRIVFPGAKNLRIAYKSGSSYKEISKRIAEDSEEKASSAINGTGAVRYNSGNDVVVYTNVLSEFIVYTKTSSDDNSSNNGTNGGTNSGTVSGSPYGNGGSNSNFYVGSVTTPENAGTFIFDDMINHWAKMDVMSMYKSGIVSGVSETMFDPDRNITRAEFAAIIARALSLTDRPANYDDVDSEDWFAGYVGACSDAGIISGFDGKFRPNDNITREEMAVVIVNAYSYLDKPAKSGGIDNFTDKDEISDWAKEAVDAASAAGLISGMGDGTFAPKANATRAQAASIVKRLLDK